MTYWTYRTGIYRDAYRYTDESVTRLRRDLHDTQARVAPVGGLADLSSPADYLGFNQAVRHDAAIGRSVFGAATSSISAWEYLRRS
jgi:hypothetical protein